MILKLISLAATASLAVTGAIAQPSMPVASATQDGKTLVVPQAQKSKGSVYYALTGRDRQIYFESNAPLEDIKGQSNKVIGYAVADPSSSAKLVAGEWHLPVDSMKTGIELRDEHLASSDWLDAASYPNIIVQVRDMKNVRQTKSSAAFTSFTGTLVADVTLHGVTKTLEIPATSVTMMNESEATRKVANGDLMAVRSSFSVKLAEYGISHPVIGDKVANEVEIDVSLYLSTQPPARQ